jgi:hypothetical protein
MLDTGPDGLLYQWRTEAGNWVNVSGGGGTGAVSSVFGRTGAVIAIAGDYTVSQITNAVSTVASYADPVWITSLSWAKITGAPSAVVSSVFGRSGAVVAQNGDYTAAQITNAVSTINAYPDPAWITSLSYSKLIGVPPSVASFNGRVGAVIPVNGDYTAAMITNAASTASTYADPAWITSLSWPKITGAPSFVVDPTTTKGDLIVRGLMGSPPQLAITRLPVGTDGQVLSADSSQTLGLRWIAPASGTGGGQPQTPWYSNINAASYQLQNAGAIRVGAGAPSYPLDVDGSVFISSSGAPMLYMYAKSIASPPSGPPSPKGDWRWLVDSATGQLRLQENTAAAYDFSSINSYWFFTGGNVGLGKAPSYTLDVNGDSNVSGAYRVNGTPLNEIYMRWVPYTYTSPPQSFLNQDLTRDGDWTMVANKDTSTRPAPQQSAPEQDLLPGWTPTLQSARATYTVLDEWTLNQGGWIDQYGADILSQNLGAQHALTLTVNGVVKDSITAIPSNAGIYWHNITPLLVASGGVVRVTLQVTILANNLMYWEAQTGLFATPPTYCSLAQGSKDGGAMGTTGYGCHLLFIPGTFSPDWDVVAFGGAAAGGGGSMVDPTSAQGDLIVRGLTGSPPALATTRLPVGAHGQVLTADSTQALGIRWGTSAGGGYWVGGSGGAIYYNGGNVGIGTATPTYPLHVVGTAYASTQFYSPQMQATGIIYVGPSAANDYVALQPTSIAFDSTASNLARWQIIKQDAESSGNAGSNLYVNRYSDAGALLGTPVYINRATGNMGIGTTTPGCRLDINGETRIIGSGPPTSGSGLELAFNVTVAYVICYNRGTSSYIAMNVDGNPLALNSGSKANVGIGTVSPLQTLDLSSTLPTIGLRNTSAASPKGYWRLYANSSGGFGLQENTASAFDFSNLGERFTVLSGGNVGINTGTPSALFEVNGVIRSIGQAGVPTTGSGLELYWDGTNSWIHAYNRTTPGFLPLTVRGAGLYLNSGREGNVGIGTSTPSAQLEVFAGSATTYAARFGNANVNMDLGQPDTTGAGPCINSHAWALTLQTQSQNRIFISLAGLVGVNTSSPGFNLDVGGNLRVTQTGTTTAAYAALLGNSSGNLQIGGCDGNNVAINVPSWGLALQTGGTTRVTINTSGNVGLGMAPSTILLQLATDSAAKPSTTAWQTWSDIRLKRNIQPLTGGLPIINQLKPLQAEYNGLGNTPEGARIVSVDAAEIRKILPHTVTSHPGKLRPDDENDTDILAFNPHEVLFHLILAVQQLSARINA